MGVKGYAIHLSFSPGNGVLRLSLIHILPLCVLVFLQNRDGLPYRARRRLRDKAHGDARHLPQSPVSYTHLDVYKRQYRKIADQIRAFKKKRTELSREKQLAEAYDQRVEGMGQYIQKTNYLKRQFDDELVRRLIKAIMVISEDKIEIQFHSGIVMSQRINEYD